MRRLSVFLDRHLCRLSATWIPAPYLGTGRAIAGKTKWGRRVDVGGGIAVGALSRDVSAWIPAFAGMTNSEGPELCLGIVTPVRVRVLERLAQGWSSRLPAGLPATPVTSSSPIYRFIYAQIARKKNYSWRHYLPRAKSKRGHRKPKASSPASFISLRRPLAERPHSAEDRRSRPLSSQILF